MPTWQPNWEDVRFDYAGAEAAAADCDGCAAFVAARNVTLGPVVAAARVEWRGHHRQRFDNETAALDHEAETLMAELRSAALRIRAEADAARVEQRHREYERERWYQEKAFEEAAERLRLEEEEAARLAAAATPTSGATTTPSGLSPPGTTSPTGAIVLTPV